jgi:hypothetical protein
MHTFMHVRHPDSHYFEAHPWQGTFALTLGSMALVGMIVLAILLIS